MTHTVKCLSNSVSVGTTNNTIFSATCCRLLNPNTSAQRLISVFDVNANVQIGSIVMNPLTDLVLEKRSTDVLTANNGDVVATKINFSN